MDLVPKNNVNGTGSNVHESARNAFNNNGTTCVSHLSKMAAVDIEFNNVTYSVSNLQKGNKLFVLN